MTFDEFIKNVVPHMKSGWVAMDKDGTWEWYEGRPKCVVPAGMWTALCITHIRLDMFNIEPVEDWIDSLIEVKNVQ